MYLRKNQQSNYHVKKKKRNLERMFLSATKVPNDRSISIRLYLFHKNFRLFRTFNTFFLNHTVFLLRSNVETRKIDPRAKQFFQRTIYLHTNPRDDRHRVMT